MNCIEFEVLNFSHHLPCSDLSNALTPKLIYKQTQGKTYCNTIKHTYNSKTITISKGV